MNDYRILGGEGGKSPRSVRMAKLGWAGLCKALRSVGGLDVDERFDEVNGTRDVC